MILESKKIYYILEKNCFPFCGSEDLEYKLRTVMTETIIRQPNYVLALVVPFDKRPIWEMAIKYAAALRRMPSDYRYSLLKYKVLNDINVRKKYSYVSKNFRYFKKLLKTIILREKESQNLVK